MKCTKCESENQQGKFCSNCGTKLKEKCPECGQMELIGRLVCETKLQKIDDLKWDYIIKERKMWRFVLLSGLIGLIIIFGCISPIFLSASFLEASGIFLFCFCLSILIGHKCIKFQKQAEKIAEKEFWQKHPDYVEIIKKAKGGK